MPTEAPQSLISVGKVVDGGHTVFFAEEFVRISDKGGKYHVTYDRGKATGKFARQWKIPLIVLMELTNERRRWYPTVDESTDNDSNDEDDDDQGDQRPDSSSSSSSSSSSAASSSNSSSAAKR